MNYRRRFKDLYGPPQIPKVCSGEGISGLVSVLIPTFNRGYILNKSLDSVFSQDYPLLEVIVVDDGSTDNTPEVIAPYLAKFSNLKYLRQENAGLVSARNAGLSAARGEFLALQDSDDIWLPGKLSAQVAVLKANSELVLCWGQIHHIDESGSIVKENALADFYSVYKLFDQDAWMPRQVPLVCGDQVIHYRTGDIFPLFYLGNLVHPPDAVMRRSAVAAVGGLDQTYAYAGEDYEFFWRISAQGKGALLDRAQVCYRVGAADQMTDKALLLSVALGYEKIIKNRLKNYPWLKEKLGQNTIDQQIITALSWVVAAEFYSPHGQKWNGLLRLLFLAKVSPSKALRMLPLVIEALLPVPIRNLMRRALGKKSV